MKTKVKTMIALIVTAIMTTTLIKDAVANTYTQSEVIGVKKINKIKVSGNVELFITQSLTDGIKIYENKNAKSAVISLENGELSISSAEKVYVAIQVSDLQSIKASDNVIISTYNTISSLNLAIALKDDASAVLNTEALNVTAKTAGSAKLILTGSSNSFEQEAVGTSKIDVAKFKAGDNSSELLFATSGY